MKFKVKRDKLQKALSRVSSAIPSRSQFLMLGNVLMEADDNKLTLTTTDVELRISTSVEAEVSEPGRTTAPARKLASLVAYLAGEDVEFTVDELDHIRISCGTGKFKLLGLAAADFPEEEKFASVRKITMKESDLKRMIGSISYAVSADDARKVLIGVLMSLRESLLTLVATDGKRMAMREKSPESVEGADGDVIIPHKAINEVRKQLDGDGVVTISAGDKECVFEGDSFRLRTKLIEGNYPNYRQVVPSSFKETVEIPVAAFLSKIETVALVVSDNNAFIVLDFSDNKLTLSASSSDVGEGSDVIDIAYSGEPIKVSFNPVFLADPLRNTDSESVTLKINDALNPVAIEGKEGFLYVIMPIRKN